MNYERYSKKLKKQFSQALDVYEKMIFVPFQRFETLPCVRTLEHFRTPPVYSESITVGEKWGGPWQNLWLHTDVNLPETLAGKQVWLTAYTGAAEMMGFKNGTPIGLINSKNKFIGGSHSALFLEKCTGATSFALDLECYAWHYHPGCAPYENYGHDVCDEKQFVFTFDGLELCVMDEAINRMIFDLSTLLQLADYPEDNFISGRALRALKEAFPAFIQDPIAYDRETLDAMAKQVCDIVAPALKKLPKGQNDGTRGTLGLIGHSHMDTAWLWPVAETVRKCARTYSEALSIMDRYPIYNFIQSSALHLYWMEQYYPTIFEGIKKRVAEGRYEPNGGVWVECDCNITGGESMVRQFFYGQRYTKEKLGYVSDVFWLPDTFGYNAAIPQIMKGAGVKYFLTQKISWNDLNPTTVGTFVWRGMDGTEVLTHYNMMHTMPDPKSIRKCVNDIPDKSSADSRLLAYGYGDGGGGPTYGMLEYLDRVIDLPGMPAMSPTTVSAFMQEQEKKQAQLPLYDGELYLEFHRGTLTSIHGIKRNNRKAEIALHELEFLEAATGKADVERIEALYKVLLINQFHDILPGSSIAEVNDRARKEVSTLIADVNAEIKGILDENGDSEPLFINPAPVAWAKEDVLTLNGNRQGCYPLCQSYTDVFGQEKTDVVGLEVPAYGSAHCSAQAEEASTPFKLCENRLDTPFYEAVFAENGGIGSLWDKKNARQVVRAGARPLGTLYFGENVPDAYENWELGPTMENKLFPVENLLSRETVSVGQVECRVRSVYGLTDKTTATVDTVFYATNPRIDYDIKLDWQDKHKLLKLGFDVNVKSRTFKNEIQFGYVERPTTRSNSFEAAKFEVVNHKWSDLSDTRYGVALLNDCKYGISCKESDLRLTLQCAGTHPDPRGDAGVHEMHCALLPHAGGFSTETVVAPAYKFNMPLRESHTKESIAPLFTTDATHVLCETVKPAQDIENAFVLRFYECEGAPEEITISVPGAKKVQKTNLLEEKQTELSVENGSVRVDFRPFEIVTLLIEK